MTDVTVVTTPDDGSCGIGTYTGDLLRGLPGSAGVRVERVTFPSGSLDPLAYVRVLVATWRSDADVVHLQHEYGLFGPASLMSWLFLPALCLLTRPFGTPVVVTLHSAWNREMLDPDDRVAPLKRLYIRLNNRLVAATATHLLFLSENCLADFRASVALPAAAYTLLPHGVPVTERRDLRPAAAKALFDYEPDDTVVVEPGYLRREKGCHVFVDVAAAFPDAEFLLAGGERGDGTYRDSLAARAGENVTISGVLGDERFHAAFVAADLVVLPYLEMTQSGVFNWCAVYECPVAASDHRYFERLRTEWGCVATFDVEDRAETVDRIRSLLASDDERRRLSDAIATYRDAHSFEAVARSHADLYRRIDGAEP